MASEGGNMEEARRITLARLLVVLAVVAFAAAAVALTNITEWTVKAQGAPVVKVAGSDVDYKYVTVGTYAASDGTNRTTITVVGFKGDITRYTSVLKICNKNYTKPVTVSLVYRQLLSGSWAYVKYIKIIYPGSSQNPTATLYIDSNTSSGTSISLGTVYPGSCTDDIGVEVLVTPDAPSNANLITIEVDVVSTG